ncbi:MAG: alpha/beta hydrolase [Oscillatoriales cyanobacterium]|nr:MAG: alpha/beta hydrolase [Oscillatoriales cyanobacterium]
MSPLELTSIAIPAPSGNPRSTVVLLHGWGANDRDLLSIAQALNLPDCQFIFPNATFAHPGMPGARMWYELGPQLEFDRDPEGIEASRTAIAALLERVAIETAIPLSQTVLAGFSQGGAMTLDVGMRLPLAGVVSLSGYLHAALDAEAVTIKPALVMHGSADPVVPFGAAIRVCNALKQVGIGVEFHEFAIGHGICPEEIAVFREFLVKVLG